MIGKIERNLIDYLLKHKRLIYFVVITILAILIRMSLFDFKSADYNIFLNAWYFKIAKLGGLTALKNQVGNYSVPYQFLIALFTYIPVNNLYLYKMLSVIFDFLAAYFGAKLVHSIDKKIDILLPYTVILAIPTVIFNSSLWAQADAIYTGVMIGSLWMLYQRKYIPSFIFLGIALSFKLQAIFIFPFYLLVYLLRKDFSILHFFISLISLYLCNIPGFIYGRKIFTPFEVYLNQAGTYKKINMNFPNFTSLLNFQVNNANLVSYRIVHNFLIIFTVIILIMGYMFILNHHDFIKIDGQEFLLLAIWTFWTCIMFLPGMHERYGFFVDVLLPLAVIEDRKLIPVAFLFILSSTIAYVRVLFGMAYNFNLISYVVIGAYVYFTFFVTFNRNNERLFSKHLF